MMVRGRAGLSAAVTSGTTAPAAKPTVDGAGAWNGRVRPGDERRAGRVLGELFIDGQVGGKPAVTVDDAFRGEGH